MPIGESQGHKLDWYTKLSPFIWQVQQLCLHLFSAMGMWGIVIVIAKLVKENSCSWDKVCLKLNPWCTSRGERSVLPVDFVDRSSACHVTSRKCRQMGSYLWGGCSLSRTPFLNSLSLPWSRPSRNTWGRSSPFCPMKSMPTL